MSSSPSSVGNNVFVQDLNPMSGRAEWTVRAADYDYRQEVARAGFADMLHDEERVRVVEEWHMLKFLFFFWIYSILITTQPLEQPKFRPHH